MSSMPFLVLEGGNGTIIQEKSLHPIYSARSVADVEAAPEEGLCTQISRSFQGLVLGSADQFEFEVNLAQNSRSFMQLLGATTRDFSCTITSESILEGLGRDGQSEGSS